MNIDELLRHDKIGVDIDGTLIEHPRSHILQQFILDHYKKKEFHLVTFRSHGMEDQIEDDLESSTAFTQVPLRLHHFAAIHTIPYPLFERHAIAKVARLALIETPKIILADNDFYAWKAEICREIGCTVLIDDMEPAIGEHCARLGVVCLNPDHY